MIVGYGTVVPNGYLPVYSVDTEEEAKQLLTVACGTTVKGEFFARELATEQTIENLFAFGDRLARAHHFMQEGKRASCPETDHKPGKSASIPKRVGSSTRSRSRGV